MEWTHNTELVVQLVNMAKWSPRQLYVHLVKLVPTCPLRVQLYVQHAPLVLTIPVPDLLPVTTAAIAQLVNMHPRWDPLRAAIAPPAPTNPLLARHCVSIVLPVSTRLVAHLLAALVPRAPTLVRQAHQAAPVVEQAHIRLTRLPSVTNALQGHINPALVLLRA